MTTPSSKDGMNYRPAQVPTKPVVGKGDFQFAAAFFDHGHIYAQIDGLAAAGGELVAVFDPDPSRYDAVLASHPEARPVDCYERLLEDPAIQLVTAAAVPSERAEIGIRTMRAGKDYFTDKSPFTTLEQLARVRQVVRETKRKYMVCYSERLLSESAYHAGELIREGAIGTPLQVLNLAPHNLNAASRPEWFFDKARYGGILTDIGSHQFEQFLHYTASRDGTVLSARVDNLGHPEFPGLEDFGEASLVLSSGASAYCRLDWFNPAGSKVWGDGRTFVLGTKGYLEIRKYRDLVHGPGDRIYLVDDKDEHLIECAGRVGFPFFGKFVLDCLNRTENAMTQEHAFAAAELSMKAQAVADAAPRRKLHP